MSHSHSVFECAVEKSDVKCVKILFWEHQKYLQKLIWTKKKGTKWHTVLLAICFVLPFLSASYNAEGEFLKIVRVLGRWTVKKILMSPMFMTLPGHFVIETSLFLWILSMCKLRRITHKLSKAFYNTSHFAIQIAPGDRKIKFRIRTVDRFTGLR